MPPQPCSGPSTATAELAVDTLRWRIDSDVTEFERRLAAGDVEGAMALSASPLLTGFDAEAGAFAEWLAVQRAALQQRRRDAALALGASAHTAPARAAGAAGGGRGWPRAGRRACVA